MTRRFLQHLLLISLARTILTVIGRGRAWDEWDEGKLVEPAQQRSHRSRFVQTLSFGALFVAGLAFSAGAGNTVQSLVDNGSAVYADSGASGPSGPTGATGVTDAPKAAEAAPATPAAPAAPERVAQAQQAAAPARPVAAPAPARAAVQSAAPVVSRPVVTGPVDTTKKAAAATTRAARPSRVVQGKPQAKPRQKASAPKVEAKPPALDPEVKDFPASTVWLNRAAPDPTPPAARLKLSFARELVAYSRKAHVDWALVLATLRAEGRNGGAPAGRVELRSLADRLAATGGRLNPWAAALAYSSDTSLADRVVALRHFYRAVGVAALVDGLLSQKADLQDRVLHDSRLNIYAGGRHDIAAGHVDVRVLATMLYLADTFHEVTVSCLISGHRLYARPGVVSAHIYGRAVDVAALNNVSIYGHQQPGGITEQAVRALLMLPGGMEPAQVISLLSMGGPSFALANHYDHIHVGY